MGDLYDRANQLIAVDYSCKELHITDAATERHFFKSDVLKFQKYSKKILKTLGTFLGQSSNNVNLYHIPNLEPQTY